METEKHLAGADEKSDKYSRTVRIDSEFEVTIHTAHDPDHLPVSQQELDLLLTWLGPLIERKRPVVTLPGCNSTASARLAC